MKKVLLFTVVAMLLLAAMSFAGDGILIFRWATPTTGAASWTSVGNPVLAAATGSDAWQFTQGNSGDRYFDYNNKGFIALEGTPTWTQLGKVTWNVDVSQWIYVYIGYTTFDIHVDMPGKYTTDDLQIHVISNAKVYTFFNSDGDLVDNDGHTIPTYLAYETDQYTTPPTPWNNGSQGWTSINALPNQANYWTVSGTQNDAGGLDTTWYIWFGFEVGQFTNKGSYSTYIETNIMADP